MILASELLDLIDASSLTFADIGGVEGLVHAGAFTSKEQVVELLKLLEGYHVINGTVDGLYETMWEIGTDELQLQAMIELDLVRYKESDYIPDPGGHDLPQTIGVFILTGLGKKFVEEIDGGAPRVIGDCPL